MRRAFAPWLVVTGLAGCASRTKPAFAPAADPATRVHAFEDAEEGVLRDLAAIDRRLAKRARITPREDDLRKNAMSALFAEDPSVVIVDGAIDPFSFDARGRGLAAVKQKIAKLPTDLPATSTGMTPSPAFERDLLARLVDEEVHRLEEERALPRSASALVRALVDTWPVPTSVEQIGERDRWVARRLREVRESMTKATLDPVRARELDDALDALEHLLDAPGFQKSTAELVHVREALEAQGTRPPEGARSEWADVAHRLKAHVGITAAPEAMDRALDAAEKDLKKRADAAVLAAKLPRDVLVARLASAVFATTDCLDAVPGSRVRSMAAPPERAPACHLRHLVASAADDTSRAVGLAAMHDHVVVAQWALDVARGQGALSQATNRHLLFALPTPDTMARLERLAQARPVIAIAAGELARILSTSEDPAMVAGKWNARGDVPFDVADR